MKLYLSTQKKVQGVRLLIVGALFVGITFPHFLVAAVLLQPNLGSSKFRINSAATYTAREGLLAAWTFDGPDMNSTIVADKGPSRYSGTITNFSSITKVLGRAGQALVFDGIDDFIVMGDVAESGRITLAAWVKPAVVAAGMKIVSKKTLGISSQYGLGTSDSNPDKFISYFYSSSASSDECESDGVAGTYEADKWYFVVATYNGAECKMYVNGIDVTLVVSDLASGNILNATNALRIGAEGGSSPSGYFAGAIDDVRIYNRAYTSDEVVALYIKMLGSLKIRSTIVPR